MRQGGRHMGEGRRFGKDECGREGSIAPFPGSNWGPHASRDVVHSASRQVHIRDIARDRVRAREGMRGEEGLWRGLGVLVHGQGWNIRLQHRTHYPQPCA